MSTPSGPTPSSHSAPTADAPGEGSRASSAFAHLPVTAENHFALLVHAAVYVLATYLRVLRDREGEDPDAVFEAYPFLGQYLAEDLAFLPEDLTWPDGIPWWMDQIECWEEGRREELPLGRLLVRTRVSPAARLALMLAGLVEEDARVGDLYADLQGRSETRRPTIGLIGHLLSGVAGVDDVRSVCDPLLRGELVVVENESAPRTEWSLRIPKLVWSGIRRAGAETEGSVERRSRDELPAFEDLILDRETTARLARVPELVGSGRVRSLIVRGSPGSQRTRALEAVFGALGRGVLRCSEERLERPPRGLGAFCTLADLVPIVEVDPPPGESRPYPEIRGYDGPVGVALGRTGGLTGGGLDEAVQIDLPALGPSERRSYWEELASTVQISDLAEIVDRFRLPGDHLRRTGRLAVRRAALEDREAVTPEDVRRASRILGREKLDVLAERLDGGPAWDQLVVDAATEEELRVLESQCRHRERLTGELGPAFGSDPGEGVRALFTGSSGTGKTLAARILAEELGKDLYRVDLSAVIDKYVGETEKNLHRVLGRAEELDVVLLLDEGDALLGRRTEVTSANDRYANVETDYLLQRLETYRGIVLVTTNLAGNVDPAFERRMDRVVSFAAPSAEEREQIWRIHLPEDHAVADATIRRMASRCEMTGGQIRNAALRASLLALDAESALDGDRLKEAVCAEYRKVGELCPLETGSEGTGRGVERFVRGASSENGTN